MAGQGWVGATMLSASAQSQSFTCPSDALDVAIGAEVTLRLQAEGEELMISAIIAQREDDGERVRYTSELVEDLKATRFEHPVLRQLSERVTPRVKPARQAPVLVEINQSGRRRLAKVANVSTTGLGLDVPFSRQEVSGWGTRIQVRVDLPQEAEPFNVPARLRHIRPCMKGCRLGVELIFDATSVEDRLKQTRLERYVTERREEMFGTEEDNESAA